MENSNIITKVKEAMENHELRAYYQPQYDATTKQLKSAEALVRWIREDGTVQAPGSFLPELEKTNAIMELDWYMVKEVCTFLSAGKAQGIQILPISVNFSRWHLYEGDMAEHLAEVMDSYGLEHNLITVEITESSMIDESKLMQEMVERLHKKGFHVSIDDFGSGLSSFSMVTDIQADELKIDKSLLSKNCEDEKERIVLESIFLFANRLNMVTVAEGVETKEQLGFLRTCNCQLIQGFFFDKPLPEEEYMERLKNQHTDTEEEDILEIQTAAAAVQLLLNAICMRYPLIIYINLSKNSFYMLTYENYTAKSCPSTGNFDELITHGTMSMHPEDQQIWADTFCAEHQLKLYQEGQREIHLVTRQIGDDGIYRKVETSNYFVKNPASNDILVISLCNNLE